MNIIGNLSISVPLAEHLQIRLHQLPNTDIQIRGLLADNPTQERVVIQTDMVGWQQVDQLIKEYDYA